MQNLSYTTLRTWPNVDIRAGRVIRIHIVLNLKTSVARDLGTDIHVPAAIQTFIRSHIPRATVERFNGILRVNNDNGVRGLYCPPSGLTQVWACKGP